MECNDYSGEPRVQGYELCPPGWHDKFVASPEMRKIQRGIDAVAREKKSSIENQEFEKAKINIQNIEMLPKDILAD